jgi:hypothetical protein
LNLVLDFRLMTKIAADSPCARCGGTLVPARIDAAGHHVRRKIETLA